MKPNKLIPILIFALSVSVGVYADEDDDDDEVQQVEVVNTPLEVTGEVTGTITGEVEVTNTVGVDVLSLPSNGDDGIDLHANIRDIACGASAATSNTCVVAFGAALKLYSVALSMRGSDDAVCRAELLINDISTSNTHSLLFVHAKGTDFEQTALPYPKPLLLENGDEIFLIVTNAIITTLDLGVCDARANIVTEPM